MEKDGNVRLLQCRIDWYELIINNNNKSNTIEVTVRITITMTLLITTTTANVYGAVILAQPLQ